jgi:hypothetical protein
VKITFPSGFILLTIAFVTLKALGYLDWSWWLVFSPLWGPIVLVLGVVVVAVLITGSFGVLLVIHNWMVEHFEL